MYVSFLFNLTINQSKIITFCFIQVLERVTQYLRAQDKIRILIGPAIRNLSEGRTIEFVKLLETFLETRALRSRVIANESVLQSIVEIILDEPNNRVPELRLVLDGTKDYGDGRYGFVDIFILPMVTAIMGQRTRGIVLELKNITSKGLWNGEMNNWNRQLSYSDLEKLQNKLCTEDDESLLARNYMYWSKEQCEPVLTTLGTVIEDAVKQLQKYMQIIIKGKRKSYLDSGVMDSRVKISEGHDELQGHVIIAIGGKRILVRSTELMSTPNKYQKTLHF